jgi:hypothetical protein
MEVFISHLLWDGYVITGVLVLAVLLQVLINAGLGMLRFVRRRSFTWSTLAGG